MRRIVRSDDVKLSEHVFLLRDHSAPKASLPLSSSSDEFVEDIFSGEEEATVGNAEAAAIGEEIVKRALEQATQIIGDASRQAQSDYAVLMERAHAEAEQLRQQAYQEGLSEGARAQLNEVRQCIVSLEQTVCKLEGEQAGFITEYEQNLKWFALEIASKILNKRIEKDNTEMIELVKEAVGAMQNSKWVTVEVSNSMPALFDVLIRTLRSADNGRRVDVRQISAPPGTCVIDTPGGVVDASVYTQLQNLKDYFENEQP